MGWDAYPRQTPAAVALELSTMNREHNERGAPVQDVRGCNDSISVFSDAVPCGFMRGRDGCKCGAGDMRANASDCG
jgi:hypothetical protein